MFEKDSKPDMILVTDMLREIYTFLKEFGCDIDTVTPPEPKCNTATGELSITNPIFSFLTNKEKGISEEDEFMCKLLIKKNTSPFYTKIDNKLFIADECIDNSLYHRHIVVDPVNLAFLYNYKEIIKGSYSGLPDEVRKTFKDTMVRLRDDSNKEQSDDIRFVKMNETLSIRTLSKEIQKFFHSAGMDTEPLVKPRVFIDKINGDMTMEPLQITLILPNSKKSLDSEKMTIGTTNELLKYIYKLIV